MITFTLVDMNCFAFAGSFFWWKKVYLGKAYFDLPRAHRMAVKVHEMGHVKGHHTEWRILTLLFCPILFFWVCRKQEFLADEYAAKMHCGKEMIEFLQDHPGTGRRYPSNAERIKRISRLTPVTGNIELSA
jgi:Zn-dependent protease with chaperone function